MSYLVLARKWRPKRFSELVGQEHVVRALSNALDSGRVHHAFLFTGTRGVGKTTIARIFAKSLNCERGTSAEPCGECMACLDIDAGRYIDLLEIDAASNTGVDDVREVIENAQYMPSRGHYKVYLIDEVHMLSKAAFNALLKTLEEPPEHVKFLLATTDPQKLPVTVLSRCLQFNLKRLDETQISGQVARIVEAERIQADAKAIALIAKAADGSLRDALSLLDQTIAYAGGALRTEVVSDMLGTVDHAQITAFLEALSEGDGRRLLDIVAALAEFSPDWRHVLEALAEALHRIQVRQLVPESKAVADDAEHYGALAKALRPEVVQLWYQMAIMGRRDIDLAPSARVGFEMTILRMLAFRPCESEIPVAVGRASERSDAAQPSSTSGASQEAAERQTMSFAASSPIPEPGVPVSPAMTQSVESVKGGRVDSSVFDPEWWLTWVADTALKGPARELAAHSAFIGLTDGVLTLSLAPGFEYLAASQRSIETLAEALSEKLDRAPRIVFASAPSIETETLNQRRVRERDQRQHQAETVFLNDPHVRHLIDQQGAKLVPNSIRPTEE